MLIQRVKATAVVTYRISFEFLKNSSSSTIFILGIKCAF
jgi:hypothetical protein